jgi:flavin reductase (DIM6/NTAB) family NADH-FMN oxidoreductase RutF
MVITIIKNKIKPSAFLFPMPVVIVGANVNGKANFETLAYVGIIEYKPPLISIASYETHHTNIGIRKNRTFSVNTPTESIIEATDYYGIVSGKDADKSEVLDVFYGELKTAPMIHKSPLNLECKVIKIIDLKELVDVEKSHTLFIGEVMNAYADDEYLTEGTPDITKLKTFTYSLGKYWKIGKELAEAWKVGKVYEK